MLMKVLYLEVFRACVFPLIALVLMYNLACESPLPSHAVFGIPPRVVQSRGATARPGLYWSCGGGVAHSKPLQKWQALCLRSQALHNGVCWPASHLAS